VQEEQSAEMGVRQDASAEARRALGEELKSFRSLPDEAAKSAAVPAVLKRLQDEIDALSKRSRSAEKAFLVLIKDLLDAPDPVPALSSGVETIRLLNASRDEAVRLQAALAEARGAGAGAAADARAELERLRRENAALDAELGKLSNQDITIRELEGRLEDFEAAIEGQVGARLAAREAELRRAFEGELEAVREAETAAEGRMAALAASLADAVGARDEAQAALFSTRARFDDELSAKQAEADSAAAEAARLREALAAAQMDEARRGAAEDAAAGGGASFSSSSSSSSPFSLSSSSAAPPSDAHASLRAQIDVHRARTEAAEEECARLAAALAASQEEARRWGDVLEARRKLHEDAVADAAARVAQREGEAAALRKELAERPAPAELAHLRHQLALLQSMHFNAEGEGVPSSAAGAEGLLGDDAAPGSGSGGGGGGGGDGELLSSGGTGGDVVDVSALMLRRIRQLEAKLVRAESARVEAEREAKGVRAALDAAQETLEEQRAALVRLEDAIANGTLDSYAGSGGAGGGGGGPSPRSPDGGDRRRGMMMMGGGGGGGDGDGGGVPPSTPGLLSAQLQLDAIVSSRGTGGGGGLLGIPATPSAAGSSSGSGAGGGGGGPLPTLFGSPSSSSSSTALSPRRDSLVLDMGGNGGPLALLASPGLGDSSAGGGGGGAMAGVLRSQRDRLRVRVQELEAEAGARVGELAEAHGRLTKLTADNVRMYEKIRFLQSFLQDGSTGAGGLGSSLSSSSASSSLGAGATAPSASALLRARAVNGPFSLSGEDDAERDYRKLYQDSLDPFASFARDQRARQYSRLSTADRMTLRGGKLIVGSKFARNFMLVYALMLHMLVASTLWHFTQVSHSSSCMGGGGEGGGMGAGGGGGGGGGLAGGAPMGLAARS
jgi:hypothetical protein